MDPDKTDTDTAPAPPGGEDGDPRFAWPSWVVMAASVLVMLILALGLRLLVTRATPAKAKKVTPRAARAAQQVPGPAAAVHVERPPQQPEVGPNGPIKPLPAGEHEAALLELLEAWRTRWEARDLEGYMALYSPTFGAQAQAVEDWRARKQRVFEIDEPISVETSDVKVTLHRHIAVISFRQLYSRGAYSDQGHKTLYLRLEPEGWRIFGEEWSPFE